jgi:hypothetical protein
MMLFGTTTMSFRKIGVALALLAALWVAPVLANGVAGHIGSLDPILQRRVQEALLEKGFDPGPIDGDYGKQTNAALIAFREANGILMGDNNDLLTPDLAKALFNIDIVWGETGLDLPSQLKVLQQLGLVPTESYWAKYAVFPD